MEKVIQTELGEQIASFHEIDYPGMEFHILASIDSIKGCVVQAENMEDAEFELRKSCKVLALISGLPRKDEPLGE